MLAFLWHLILTSVIFLNFSFHIVLLSHPKRTVGTMTSWYTRAWHFIIRCFVNSLVDKLMGGSSHVENLKEQVMRRYFLSASEDYDMMHLHRFSFSGHILLRLIILHTCSWVLWAHSSCWFGKVIQTCIDWQRKPGWDSAVSVINIDRV